MEVLDLINITSSTKKLYIKIQQRFYNDYFYK